MPDGIKILSKSPISYSYFSEQFSHTIDFLNKATVTFTFDQDPDG